MSLNFHAGYGKLIAESLASLRPYTGRIYIVATSTLAGWDEMTQIFPVGEGNTRVWGTLKELLDSGLIQDGGDDLVFVLPNHTETVRSAAALDTGTVAAGLTIVGLGEGDERPLFTFQGATTADFDIGSNGVTVENCRFDLTGIDALVAPFDINSTQFKMRKCEVITADSDGQCVNAFLTDANAGGFTLEDCYVHGSGVAGTTSAVRIVGGVDHKFIRTRFDGNYKLTAGAIQVTTTAAGVELIDCIINNRTPSSTAAMDFVSDSTAILVGCTLGILSGTSPIHVNEQTTFGGKGSITTARNYYRNATTIAAGTLL